MGTALLDTVRVGGNVGAVDFERPGWRWSCERVAPGCVAVRDQARELAPGVWLHVLPGQERRSAWVEGSVPRFLQGVNYPAVSARAVRVVGGEWVGMAGEFVEFTEEARVGRLDVVRDLPVGDRVGEVLKGVGGMVLGGRCVRATYRDASARHALTVWARTKRCGGGRLYDKEAESGCAEAAGVVRFEGQERRSTLGPAGVTRLAEVTDEAVVTLLRERWSWSGFGDRVLPRDEWVARVLAKEEWRWDTRLKVVGWVASGCLPVGSRANVYRLRQRVREVGHPSESQEGWRLDLERGLVAA